MTRTYKAQKAGLTRTTNRLVRALKDKRDSKGRDFDGKLDEALRLAAVKVHAECRRTVAEWNEPDRGYWPDDWHRWEIALFDAALAYRQAGGTSNFPAGLGVVAATLRWRRCPEESA